MPFKIPLKTSCSYTRRCSKFHTEFKYKKIFDLRFCKRLKPVHRAVMNYGIVIYRVCVCVCLLIEAGWCKYVSLNWVNIGSCNGLSPSLRQAITWTNDDLLSIGPLGTKFSDIVIKLHLKMSSAKVAATFSRPQCVEMLREKLYFSCLDTTGWNWSISHKTKYIWWSYNLWLSGWEQQGCIS